jgi:hypothetical protein
MTDSIQNAKKGLPQWEARHGVGRHAQGCRLYVSLSGGLVGSQRPLLDALAEVDDPTDAIQTLDRITHSKAGGSEKNS